MIYDVLNDIKEKNIDKLYDVADVTTGYSYWFWKLLNFCLTIFKYDNLPESLPAREIEANLLLTGHDVIFEVPQYGVITCNTNIFNFDVYYNPTDAIFANPLLRTKKLSIGDNCEVIYNSSLKDNVLYIKSDSSMLTFIQRYSRMLADIESTINIYTVNTRLTSYPVASNDNVAKSIKLFFKKLRAGRSTIITDDAIIQEFRNVDINRSSIRDGLNDLLIARDKILEMFFRDIGVKMYNPKKAQVSEDELQVNNQMLIISLDDMLEERRRGLEKVNKMFGLNISVDISDAFKEGVRTNAENNNELGNSAEEN